MFFACKTGSQVTSLRGSQRVVAASPKFGLPKNLRNSKNQKIEIFADEPGRAVDRGPHPLTTVLGNRRSDRATHAAVREALELGSPPAVVAAWVAGVRWLRQDGLVRRKGCSAEEGPSRVFPSYRNNPGWPFWGTFSVSTLPSLSAGKLALRRGQNPILLSCQHRHSFSRCSNTSSLLLVV
jgi:hypothetical protein